MISNVPASHTEGLTPNTILLNDFDSHAKYFVAYVSLLLTPDFSQHECMGNGGERIIQETLKQMIGIMEYAMREIHDQIPEVAPLAMQGLKASSSSEIQKSLVYQKTLEALVSTKRKTSQAIR